MKPIYIPNVLKLMLPSLCKEVLALPWETKRTARHEYFMADTPTDYSYGRQDDGITYSSRPFSPLVEHARDVTQVALMLEGLGQVEFNACFLNKYDDQHQHLGWHADDFAGMDPNAPIAVMSLGAEREIWVKEKGAKGKVPAEDRYLLESGSLFIMPAGFQDTMFHRIPKHPEPCGWRVSLTFRKFL